MLYYQHIIGASVGFKKQYLHRGHVPPPLTVSIKRNVVPVHIFRSILGLVLGEKEEIFAQRAGEFGHFLAAVMGGAGGITLPLLDTTVHLKTKGPTSRYSGCRKSRMSCFIFTCTRMSARCLSLAWRRSAALSSWINQDPRLVFRMAAVPGGGTDAAMRGGCLQQPWNHKLRNSRQLQFIQMWF